MVGGKKKRGHPDVEEVLARPWCYYCERDFDDLKILISHQKAKHFKCERCGRRLNTAGGLSVHMQQVHKEVLTSVENSLGNRAALDVEIFGMEGIPEDIVQAHNQRIVTQFYQAEAERRAATGNASSGAGAGGATKKPKFESPAELKKRLAEHKARMAEQAAGGESSGGTTPLDGAHGQSPGMGHSPAAFNGSPYVPPQIPFGGVPGANYGSFSQEPYAQPVAAYQQPFTQPAYSQAPQFAPQPQYSPPQQFPHQQAFPPPGYQQPQPHFQGGPPPQFGAAAGAPPGYNAYQPPSHIPSQHGLPARPPSLPQAPGLPQRPSFGSAAAPPQPFQMQQMHQGSQQQWGGNGWKGPDHQNPAMLSAYTSHSQGYNNASSVDELVSGAAREADDIDEIIRMAEAGIRPPKKTEPAPILQPSPVPVAAADEVVETTAAPETNEKKAKKEKDKNTRLVYSDNEVSPEERMAQLPRYAFVPDRKDDTSEVEVTQ